MSEITPDERKPSAKLACRRCRKAEVVRRPADGISPHPGYDCLACGHRMAAGSMKAMYAVAGLIAFAICASGIAGFVNGDRQVGRIGWGVLVGGVGCYCVRELFRPTPIRRNPGSTANNLEPPEAPPPR